MAITIKNNSKVFDNSSSVAIIFKQYNDVSTNVINEGDFVFIFFNEKLLGINVFNYSQYFQVNEGYHLITSEIKEYLLKNWNKYVREEDFDQFIKVGKVVEIKQHENNERLKVMQVEFDTNKLQIITNVQNVEVNNKYLFALNGATLATGMQISEAKVANVLSQGMIVSYKSLGIDKEGIIDCNNYNQNDEYKF